MASTARLPPSRLIQPHRSLYDCVHTKVLILQPPQLSPSTVATSFPLQSYRSNPKSKIYILVYLRGQHPRIIIQDKPHSDFRHMTTQSSINIIKKIHELLINFGADRQQEAQIHNSWFAPFGIFHSSLSKNILLMEKNIDLIITTTASQDCSFSGVYGELN